MSLNEDKLNALLGKFVGDLGATMHAGSIVIGEKLGLYKAMATPDERVTAGELANRTNTNERYVREWLNANAASGYVEYDADEDAYYMTPEQAYVMTNEENAAYLPGAFVLATSALRAVPALVDRFKTGDGFGWHEHHEDLFRGTELFFRPGYIANLVNAWIPALDDVEDKLKSGAKVADVGCGLGASTILMAKAFPNSEFIGFDYHDKSIEAARKKAEEAGVGDRVKFEVAVSKSFPGEGYGLVSLFEVRKERGDAVGSGGDD